MHFPYDDFIGRFDSFVKKSLKNKSRTLKRDLYSLQRKEVLVDDLEKPGGAIIDNYPSSSMTIHAFEEEFIIECYILYCALTELSDFDRQVILMYYWDELTYQEIASRLGISQQMAYYRRKQAVDKLAEIIPRISDTGG